MTSCDPEPTFANGAPSIERRTVSAVGTRSRVSCVHAQWRTHLQNLAPEVSHEWRR
jgi:hypothetical protein